MQDFAERACQIAGGAACPQRAAPFASLYPTKSEAKPREKALANTAEEQKNFTDQTVELENWLQKQGGEP